MAILPFHTFLWKVASRCNLNCSYCYVYNSVDQSWRGQPKLMPEAVALQAAGRMRRHLEAHDKRDASVVFHGGEPLLGGLPHLAMLMRVFDTVFAGSGIALSFGMQSNLLLFTPEIGDFLLSRGITIGVSLDGPPEINDVHRLDLRGRPTSARLEAKLALLGSLRYRPIFSGLLCVIDPETEARRVTDYLLDFDPPGLDFLFPLNNHDRPPVVRGRTHGEWLVESYDAWLARPNGTRVRMFQSIVNMLCGGASLVEALGLAPVDLIVVESNGEIEAVDSLRSTFPGATRLGFEVFGHSFDEVAASLGVQSRQRGAAALSARCQNCPVVEVCGGGYLPHRYSSAAGFDNPSVYCADLERLIRHIHTSIRQVAREVGAEAEPILA